MGIYNRDNVNYGSFLQNAIANKIHNAERELNLRQANAKLWGNTIKDVGNTIGKGAFYSYSDTTPEEDEAELKKLKEIKDTYNAQVEQRRKFDEMFNSPSAAQWKANSDFFDYNPKQQIQAQNATNYMSGYNPIYTRNYIPEQDKDWYRQVDDEQPTTYNPYSYAMQSYYRRGL